MYTFRLRQCWLARRSQWPEVVIVAILALLPFLFFWRLVAPNPADRAHIIPGDFTDQYYPLRAYAAGQLMAGRLPLWNPFVYGGQPALADIQSGALYPPQLLQVGLFSWLGLGFPLRALELQVIAHFSWAAVGAYVLGRRLIGRRRRALPRQARLAGVVVSLVFTYSGYLTGFPVQQLTILEVSAWLPWVLLAADSLVDALPDRWRMVSRALWTGLALALALLPGHPQTWLYVVYMTLGFYAWRVYERQAETASGPSRPYSLALRAAAGLAVAGVFALALAAVQWLPTVELIAHSTRSDMGYAALSFGLPLHEMVALIYPGYLGGSPQYLGILPLLLIGVAWALGQPRRPITFWTLAGLLALLLGLGGNTFLYPLFYLVAPGFDAVRHQERSFLIYALSAAMLSGYGALVLTSSMTRAQRALLQRLRRAARGVGIVGLALTVLFIFGSLASQHSDLFAGVLRHHIFGLILLAGCLVLLALRPAGQLRRRWGMTLLAAWIAFNLFTVNWRFNLQLPGSSPPFADTPVTQFLRGRLAAAPEPLRIASAGLLSGGPGAAAVYGFQDIVGNSPLQLASVEAFQAVVPEWRRWQLLNVHYVLSDHDLEGPGLTRLFPADASSQEGQSTRIYAMGDPFPRAWVVHAVEVIPDLQAALQRLSQDAFDLRRMAVVNEPPDLALTGATDGSSAQIVAFAANEISVRARAVSDGLLVLSEVSYPGWQASLDGAPTRLVTANGILRGIWLPAGEHVIQLWYAPLTFQVGLAASALAGVVGAGVLVVAGAVQNFRRREATGFLAPP